MVRVIVALAFAASKTSMFVRAIGNFVVATDGCGRPCVPIDISTLTVQPGDIYNARSGDDGAAECLEVGGDYGVFSIKIYEVFQCTKVAVKNGGKIANIDACPRVPFRHHHEAL
jgi:hypothetical protein